MLINLSNHPSSNWSPKQLESASIYGELVDLPFPVVDPDAGTDSIRLLADEFKTKIVSLVSGMPTEKHAVHLMGEITFCFALAVMLQSRGIDCIASTTERIVVEKGRQKTVEFNFTRFRQYPDLKDLTNSMRQQSQKR